MKNRQRGATFLGMVTMLVIVGTVVYAGIRLVPVYLEFMAVVRALEQVRDEQSAVDSNPQAIRGALERRWDVEDIHGIDWRDIGIRKTGDGYELTAAYDVEQPFLANLYLLVKFDKSLVVQQ